MKKLLLFAGLFALNLSADDTAIVRLYVHTRNLSQINMILQAQPHLVNQRLPGGITPLHELATHTHFSQVFAPAEAAQLAQLLLDRGADPTATDDNGNTALHTAALAGSPIVAAVLHQAGASSHTQNNAGLTPNDIVQQQLARATPTRVGIDSQFRAIALGLLRITTPSPGPKVQG